ncbi:MAG: hypothetical protein R3229_14420 [Alphaproteobacteria bacterium]|nr:hypothetical protein [Alphaproteobacteria bacterium]
MPRNTRRWAISITVLWLVAYTGSLHAETAASEKTKMPSKDIQEVLRIHKPRLLALEGVIGVGRGSCAGSPCLKVMVVRKTPELLEKIGSDAHGHRIEIIETGEIRAIDNK